MRGRDAGQAAGLLRRLVLNAKSRRKLERVEGIEPSYSAWKAAALPLSYTRVRPINYHATGRVSTMMRRSVYAPLNTPRIRAYIRRTINNERR